MPEEAQPFLLTAILVILGDIAVRSAKRRVRSWATEREARPPACAAAKYQRPDGIATIFGWAADAAQVPVAFAGPLLGSIMLLDGLTRGTLALIIAALLCLAFGSVYVISHAEPDRYERLSLMGVGPVTGFGVSVNLVIVGVVWAVYG